MVVWDCRSCRNEDDTRDGQDGDQHDVQHDPRGHAADGCHGPQHVPTWSCSLPRSLCFRYVLLASSQLGLFKIGSMYISVNKVTNQFRSWALADWPQSSRLLCCRRSGGASGPSCIPLLMSSRIMRDASRMQSAACPGLVSQHLMWHSLQMLPRHTMALKSPCCLTCTLQTSFRTQEPVSAWNRQLVMTVPCCCLAP